MLPIIVYAYWYGPGKGMIVGVAYALLQMIQDAYFVASHPDPVRLHPRLRRARLAGFFKKNLYVGAWWLGWCGS